MAALLHALSSGRKSPTEAEVRERNWARLFVLRFGPAGRASTRPSLCIVPIRR